MKKSLWASLIVLFGLLASLLFAPLAQAQTSTQDFTITSFTADYHLTRDAQNVAHMLVSEQIVAEFPQFDQNHGIERALPNSYKNQPLDNQVQKITDQNGLAYNYTTYKSNGNTVLRIGNASTFVHGTNVYNLLYTIKNPISFYSDHDELYWNINGVQWKQPFGMVTGTFHIPAELASQLKDGQFCYAGAYGANNRPCTVTRRTDPTNNETVIIATASDLQVNENLSVAMAFNKGTFAVDQAAKRAAILQIVGLLFMVFGIPLLLLIFILQKWFRYGRDAAGRGTIIPEYGPLPNLNVLMSDVIMQDKLRSLAVSALIIELAIRKVLIIQSLDTKKLLSRKTEYAVTLPQTPTGLTTEEMMVVNMLFPFGATAGATVNLKDLRKTAGKTIQLINQQACAALFTQGYFKSDPYKITKRYVAWGGGLLVTGLLVMKIALASDSIFFTGPAGVVVLCAFILMIAGRVMPARSDKGVEAHSYLLGLKMFMQVAEADRIKFLQSPEGVKQYGDPTQKVNQVKLFEKLLPYAMIFGIEKDWGKQFADIYSQPPDWYQGNWTTFNTIYLVDSIGAFRTVSANSFAPPSSSGSSGFGGGGFSGGGGGGGGGGGW